MSILLTGSSGFVGGHLAKVLDCECVADPFDKAAVPECDTLIHLAAITNPQPEANEAGELDRVNHLAAIDFFGECIKAGCKRIVYASSASVYGAGRRQREDEQVRPLTSYAKSKALLEVSASHLSATTGVPIIGLRFSNVYGPNEQGKGKWASVVFQLVNQMHQGQRPKLFKAGEQKRDWVSVHDVCRAITLATTKGQAGVFNVGSGIATSFNKAVKIINAIGKYNLNPEYIDNPYSGYQSYTRLDIRKAQKELCYVPEVPLWDGIGEIIKSLV